MNSVDSFKIPLNWQSVLVNGQIYPWHRKPQRVAKYRELIEGPRIYRWVFKNQNDEIQAVYIGESEKFQNRLSGYRTPTKINQQDTDVIVHNTFDDCEKQGGIVELQFLEIAAFEINGQLIDSSTKSLGNHEMRIILESIAIVTAKLEKPKLLNRLSKNVHEKDLERLLRSLPPKRKQEILDIYKANKQPS
jgi:hypothetical protein